MKKIILLLALAASLHACIPPLKPMPPIGCSYDNAVLMRGAMTCTWVYMGC